MSKGFDLDKKIVVSDLFMNTDTYVVPPYQRDYSWDKDQIENLWNDVMSCKGEEAYFIGSMVFQSPKSRKSPYIVIDGQQRLVTITILLAAIRDVLYTLNKDSAIKLNQNYILRELENGTEIRKLSLNLANKEVFYYSIQIMPDDANRKNFASYSELTKTNKLIKNAYEFFKSKLEAELGTKNLKEKISYIGELVEHIRETLLAITIYVDTEEEAYLIFETINDRSLELSVADLFKNYLIREAKSPQDKDEIIIMWKEMSNKLDDKVRAFLRHYWVSKVGQITERQLFSKFKLMIDEEKKDVKDFTKEIKDEALNYYALYTPEAYTWQDKSIVKLLEEFNILNVKQCLPLLVVGMKKFTESEFKKLLVAIINFTFRYSTICNKHNNVLEAKYSEAAIQIRSGKITNVTEAMKVLKSIYPTDSEFSKSFSTKEADGKLARYILKKIDEANAKYPAEKPDYSTCSLEHIMPQNADDEWKKYFVKKKWSEDYIDELIYKIGNLTLLDITMNKQARNYFFDKKKNDYYSKSMLWLNESIKLVKEWDDNIIINRQADLAKKACTIWKIDF